LVEFSISVRMRSNPSQLPMPGLYLAMLLIAVLSEA